MEVTERWLSAEDLAGLSRLGLRVPGSARGCRNLVKREGWPSKEVQGKGGKGGVKTLYRPPDALLAAIAALDGLPPVEPPMKGYATSASADPLVSGDGDIPRFLLKGQALSEDNFARIPFYDVRASAGHGAFVADQAAARHYAFDREWLALYVGVAVRRLALIPVSGTSMEPDLHDGDLVMIDRGDIEVLREGVYVFELDDRLYVKRLSLHGDRLVVASSNGDYPPLELNTLQENPGFKIHGRVLGSPSFKRL